MNMVIYNIKEEAMLASDNKMHGDMALVYFQFLFQMKKKNH